MCKFRKGSAGAVGQFDEETVAFFDEGPVAQPDICNGEGTPSEGPLTSQAPPPISVFYLDFGHFILQI